MKLHEEIRLRRAWERKRLERLDAGKRSIFDGIGDWFRSRAKTAKELRPDWLVKELKQKAQDKRDRKAAIRLNLVAVGGMTMMAPPVTKKRRKGRKAHEQ